MRSLFSCLILSALFVASGFSAIGDVIQFFQIPNSGPTYRYDGVAKDHDDGNLWVSKTSSDNKVYYCKIDQANHQFIVSWQQIPLGGQNLSLGYGYFSNGVKNLVFYDSQYPHLRLFNPITHQDNGSLPDPYTYGPEDDSGGIDVYEGTDYIYTSGYDITMPVKRSDYPVTTWFNLMITHDDAGGTATGWGKLFVEGDNPHKIYQYNIDNLNLESVITINGLPWSYGNDLAIGRTNAVGNHESLFFAAWDNNNPSNSGIYEIEIGDITNVSVVPTSLGSIKASFR
jgi:hypothetical protein